MVERGRGARELALLPPAALMVNVGRADTIDERALHDALRAGRIGTAGLDVWYRYPRAEEERTCTPPADLPFGELENVVLSPHRAGHSDRTAELRGEQLARLLNALAVGGAPDRVDVERGY